MRLIFTSLASHGHVYPLLPLAVAARDAGHDVLFATAEDFLPELAKAGLETAPAGITMHQAFTASVGDDETRSPTEIPPEEMIPLVAGVFGELMPSRFSAELAPHIERFRPDLVVYESGNPGGAIAARLAGIPAIGHGFGRVSLDDPVGQAIFGRMAQFAAEAGVKGADLPSFGDQVLDICPESVQAPDFVAEARRVPLRPVGWSEPGELPEGILGRDKSRPLVYLTLGTAFGNDRVLREAIAGLARLAADVVVASGPTVEVAQLGEVPPNVRLEAWVPQAALLPHVDLVVHHGGSGTTLGAFGEGLPQLVIPQGADQFTNAEAVVEAGVGDRLIGDDLTADAIFERSRKLLASDGVREAARSLADEVAAMPSPAEIAARLPEFAR